MNIVQVESEDNYFSSVVSIMINLHNAHVRNKESELRKKAEFPIDIQA